MDFIRQRKKEINKEYLKAKLNLGQIHKQMKVLNNKMESNKFQPSEMHSSIMCLEI